ncbi:MAG: tyrosine-type recombinase/integrase [Planctomycetota bacterium]
MVTLFRRGRIWWIQFRTEGRRVRESLGTDNKKLAEDLRRRRLVEVEAGRLQLVAVPAGGGLAESAAPPEPRPVVDVETALADYRAWSLAHKRPRTIRNDRLRLQAFFATVPGRALGEIATTDVERFLTQQALKGRQPATLLRYREILHAFWRWAECQGHVERNVVAPIPRPRLPERDPRFLSLDQIDELLAAVAGDRIAVLVAAAVFGGFRREELCWLTWSTARCRCRAVWWSRCRSTGGPAGSPGSRGCSLHPRASAGTPTTSAATSGG